MITKITICWTETARYRTTVTLDDHHRTAMRRHGHDPTNLAGIRGYLTDGDTWLGHVDHHRDFDAVTSRDVDDIVVEAGELGQGVLGWPSSERYGSVFLTTGPDTDHYVSFDSAPAGERGRLVAVVLVARPSPHIGDLFGGIVPTTPDVGEQVTLGAGTAFTDIRGGIPVVGVTPDDRRHTDWLDPRALYRCHSQTVRLELRRK